MMQLAGFGHSPIISRCILFVMILFFAIAALNAQNLETDLAKNWHIALSEQGGMLVSREQNLYFGQYINSLDAEFEFKLFQPVWLGAGIGYTATLPSEISEETILIRPAWASLHANFYVQAQTSPENGMVFRASVDGWYQQIANTENYQFVPGVIFGVGKQFQLGHFVLEPDIHFILAFPRDASGQETGAATVGIRLLY